MPRKPLTREELGRKLAEIDENPGIFSEFEVRLARESQVALRAAEARIEALRAALQAYAGHSSVTWARRLVTEPLDLEPIKARLARFDGEDYPAGWKGEDIPALVAEVERLREVLPEEADVTPVGIDELTRLQRAYNVMRAKELGF